MSRSVRRIAVVVLNMTLVVLLAAVPAAATKGTTTVVFNAGTLPYPNGTILTTQLSSLGLVFSSYDGDLPPEYQLSLGPQENVVRVDGEVVLTNPFRIFLLSEAVTSVSLTLDDRNTRDQSHTLTAFDASGTVIDSSSFQDDVEGDVSGTFTLSVSTHKKDPIAFVVVLEQPFGAEILRDLSYETKTKNDSSRGAA